MIRPVSSSDIPQVAAVELACFSDAWSAKLLEDTLGNPLNHMWAACEGGRTVGYGVLCLIAGEGEIQRIAVLPGWRGRGIGRELLEAMTAFAREQGAEALTLEVRAGNLAARNLYKSCGFADEAVRRGYYHSPAEDAVIMWNRRI